MLGVGRLRGLSLAWGRCLGSGRFLTLGGVSVSAMRPRWDWERLPGRDAGVVGGLSWLLGLLAGLRFSGVGPGLNKSTAARPFLGD